MSENGGVEMIEGAYYMRADGVITGPAIRQHTFPWYLDGITYTDDGFWHQDKIQDPRNLIQRVTIDERTGCTYAVVDPPKQSVEQVQNEPVDDSIKVSRVGLKVLDSKTGVAVKLTEDGELLNYCPKRPSLDEIASLSRCLAKLCEILSKEKSSE